MKRGQPDGSMQDEVFIAGSSAKTIQTHNAVSIAASGNVNQSAGPATNANGYMDCTGYDQLSVTLFNDAATACVMYVFWSNDGVTVHGIEAILPSQAADKRAARTGIKARWARTQVTNSDTIAHVLSAWVYLTA